LCIFIDSTYEPICAAAHICSKTTGTPSRTDTKDNADVLLIHFDSLHQATDDLPPGLKIRLLHIELDAPCTQAQRLIQWIGPLTADPTIEVRPRQFDCPHHRLNAARYRAACCQHARTRR